MSLTHLQWPGAPVTESPVLSSGTHHCVCTQAAPPSGCSQTVIQAADPLPGGTRLLYLKTLAWGPPEGLAQPSSEWSTAWDIYSPLFFLHLPRLFLPFPSSPGFLLRRHLFLIKSSHSLIWYLPLGGLGSHRPFLGFVGLWLFQGKHWSVTSYPSPLESRRINNILSYSSVLFLSAFFPTLPKCVVFRVGLVMLA